MNNRIWLLNRQSLNILLVEEIATNVAHISSSFDMICNFPHPLAETIERTSIVFNSNVSFIKHSNTKGKYIMQDFRPFLDWKSITVLANTNNF